MKNDNDLLEEAYSKIHLLENWNLEWDVLVEGLINLNDYRAREGTLQYALDNFLGFPQIIKKGMGKVMVRSSKKMIENGFVNVEDETITDTEHPVQSGQYIRFGMAKHKKDAFRVP